jgi:glyoxylase-like metal-dependent hydrolase (beta-lactamase superfamily II)
VIERTEHGDVSQLRLTWWRSRLIGFAVNVFVVRDVLVDTGFPAVEEDVACFAREHRVRGALVTHQHEDHAGNVERLAASGVPLGMSSLTHEVIARQQRIGFYRKFTWQSMRPLRSPFELFRDDSLELVHTPGHSHDHHVVWDCHTDTLFAGDLFLGVKVRVAHSYENPRQLISSLRAMTKRKPRRVFCAHRGFVPNGASALEAKADWLEGIIERIGQLHTSGVSENEIRKRVLGERSLAHWFSAGDYSPDNLVKAALREQQRDGAWNTA